MLLMEDLARLLNVFEQSDLPDGDGVLHGTDHPLIDSIQGLAIDLLISEEGTPFYGEIDRLYATYGYFIFPGARDQFGLLTSCIRTKKGIIVFG